MSQTVDVFAQARRKERVFKLYTKLAKDGIAIREKLLAEFSLETGASEERTLSYFRILLNAGRIEERIEDGKIWVATPQAWLQEEQDRVRKGNEVLRP